MRIVVTGAAGYVGRPVVDGLRAGGHTVIGVDVVHAPATVCYDIRAIPDMLFDGVDAVVHLAAISFAPEWDDADDLIWDVNVEGTRRVIRQCEAAGVPRFALASSASIFEGHLDPPATIATVATPMSTYGRSKVECERMLAASRISQRVAMRKGTLCGLGPQPRLDLLVNAMSFAALRHGRVYVDGTGHDLRPLLRLERAVHAYVAAATTPMRFGMHALNLCDDNVMVLDVAQQISAVTGATVIHREPRGRARSYRMVPGRTPGCELDDIASVHRAAMVRGVVAEAKARVSELPELTSDPRVDRLAAIRNATPLGVR